MKIPIILKNNSANKLILPHLIQFQPKNELKDIFFKTIFKESFNDPLIKELLNSPIKRDFRSISLLRASMQDEQIVAYLTNTSISEVERRDILIQHLRNSLIAMRSEFPDSCSPLGCKLAETRLDLARIDDNYQNCDASFRFGTNCFALSSSSSLFGIMFHELMHNLAYPDLGTDGLDKQAVHEVISDLATFAMFSKIAGRDKVLFNKWVNEFMEAVGYMEESFTFGGTFSERHMAARAFLGNIIQEARRNNIDLQELFPKLFESSVSVIRENSIGNRFKKFTFSRFASELVDAMNDLYVKHGFRFMSVPYEELKSIISVLETYTKTKVNKNKIELGIAVPKIQIVSTEQLVVSIRQLIMQSNTTFA